MGAHSAAWSKVAQSTGYAKSAFFSVGMESISFLRSMDESFSPRAPATAAAAVGRPACVCV
jgi:hypothetical protein